MRTSQERCRCLVSTSRSVPCLQYSMTMEKQGLPSARHNLEHPTLCHLLGGDHDKPSATSYHRGQAGEGKGDINVTPPTFLLNANPVHAQDVWRLKLLQGLNLLLKDVSHLPAEKDSTVRSTEQGMTWCHATLPFWLPRVTPAQKTHTGSVVRGLLKVLMATGYLRYSPS